MISALIESPPPVRNNDYLLKAIQSMSLTSHSGGPHDEYRTKVPVPATEVAAAPLGEAPMMTRSRKVAALLTVCAGLMVITLDVTILNVALPTLAHELGADNSQLQWFVNAYELVFAGLLLTAGSLADRLGRRRILTIGLVVFGVASVASAVAGSSAELIAARAVMGIGGAMVVPATLAIVTTVFIDPGERARAVAVWAGVAALGLGLGPLLGGLLLRYFYWGSVFVVSVPLIIASIAFGRLTVPESRDPAAGRLDPIGAALSVLTLGALLFAVTEGPERGWTAPAVTMALALAVAGFVLFVGWERRVEQPMLPSGLFPQPSLQRGHRSDHGALLRLLRSHVRIHSAPAVGARLRHARRWNTPRSAPRYVSGLRAAVRSPCRSGRHPSRRDRWPRGCRRGPCRRVGSRSRLRLRRSCSCARAHRHRHGMHDACGSRIDHDDSPETTRRSRVGSQRHHAPHCRRDRRRGRRKCHRQRLSIGTGRSGHGRAARPPG